jgi:hypothetical protein
VKQRYILSELVFPDNSEVNKLQIEMT